MTVVACDCPACVEACDIVTHAIASSTANRGDWAVLRLGRARQVSAARLVAAIRSMGFDVDDIDGKYRAWGPMRPGGGYMWRVEIWQ